MHFLYPKRRELVDEWLKFNIKAAIFTHVEYMCKTSHQEVFEQD